MPFVLANHLSAELIFSWNNLETSMSSSSPSKNHNMSCLMLFISFDIILTSMRLGTQRKKTEEEKKKQILEEF